MRPRGKPSRHLASRLRTGEILRGGSVPVVELQATMVIGGGSESFRIVRDLAARLPWMVLPRWMASVSEPVAIRDVAEAIAYALEMPLDGSKVFAVPGVEKLTGRELIMRTAQLMGHRPRTVSVPVVTPKLSSYWIRLVTRANLARDGARRRPALRHRGRRSRDWGSMPWFRRSPSIPRCRPPSRKRRRLCLARPASWKRSCTAWPSDVLVNQRALSACPKSSRTMTNPAW